MRPHSFALRMLLVCAVASACSSGPSGAGNTAVARELEFPSAPSTILKGGHFHPVVTVEVRDTDGTLVTNSSVTIDLHLLAGSGPGALTGIATKAAFKGVATFSDLSIDQPGDYTLVATSTGLDSAVSAPFTVDPLPTAITVEVGTGYGTIRFRSVRNGSVNPAVDTLASGGTVTWSWFGNDHSVYAVDGNFASSGVQNSPSTWPVQFTVPNTYRFNCGVHGNAMTGQIVVQ
jgi:plastocyanin